MGARVSTSTVLESAMNDTASTVLQWSYRRGHEAVVCELGLDKEDDAYELTTSVPWSLQPSTERFADAIAALQRQVAVERLLINEGWSLVSFRREERP
jgi:hypothetical protein